MPSGPVHRKATAVLIAASLPAILIFPNPVDWLAFEAGLASTLLVSPDMDIHNRLGPLGEFLGFEAYRKLVPHRGGLHERHWYKLTWGKVFALSHIPLAGTLPRMILLLMPVIVVLAIFSALQQLDLWLLIWLWLGASLSDALHTLMDLFPYRWFTYRERREIFSGYKEDRMQFYKRGGRRYGRPGREKRR